MRQQGVRGRRRTRRAHLGSAPGGRRVRRRRRRGPVLRPGRRRARAAVKITAIRLDRLRLPLDPPFLAAWGAGPRRHLAATPVRGETDEGVTGYGSGDTMDGFEPFAELFVGRDPLRIAAHVAALETISFHAGRYWPLEAALWDIIGKVSGLPVSVLFGGAASGLPAYASFGETRGPGEQAEAALAAVAAGFPAVKIRSAAPRPGA